MGKRLIELIYAFLPSRITRTQCGSMLITIASDSFKRYWLNVHAVCQSVGSVRLRTVWRCLTSVWYPDLIAAKWVVNHQELNRVCYQQWHDQSNPQVEGNR